MEKGTPHLLTTPSQSPIIDQFRAPSPSLSETLSDPIRSRSLSLFLTPLSGYKALKMKNIQCFFIDLFSLSLSHHLPPLSLSLFLWIWSIRALNIPQCQLDSVAPLSANQWRAGSSALTLYCGQSSDPVFGLGQSSRL